MSPYMLSPTGGTRGTRLALGVVALLILTGLAEVWFVEGTTADPYGLTHTTSIEMADVPNIEALYGKAWTNMGVLAWSPDGRHVAIGGSDIQVIDAVTGILAAEWTTPGQATALAWSPDGQTLAAGVNTAGFVYDGWVILYDLRGVPQASWYAIHQFIGGVAWSPTGDRIFASGDVEYSMWTSTGSLLYAVTNASTYGESASWSRDGMLVATSGPLIINATTGTPVNTPPEDESFDVAWSPQGTMLAGGGGRGTLALFRADGLPLRNTTGFRGGVFGMPVSWSPDGSLIATLGEDGLAIISATDLTTVRALHFPIADFLPGSAPTPTFDDEVAWSPTGSMIAATGTMSHPSFRLWGVRHETLGVPLAVLGLTTALGLGLLFRQDVLWVAANPDRVGMLWARTDPRLRGGAALMFFAVVSSILDSSGANALGRVYGLQTVPSAAWYGWVAVLSAPVVVLAAVAATKAFHAMVWPEGAPHPFADRVMGVYGYVLLPFLIALGVGNALSGLVLLVFPSLGRDIAVPATGLLLGGALGLAFYYSGRLVRGFPWARARFPWIALAASALASIAILFGLVALLVVGLNAFQVRPPAGDFQTYGFTILLSFGFVPLVSVVLGLVTTAALALLPSAFRFAPSGYTRAQGTAILELETRRKVLDRIVAEPGIHFRALLEATGLGIGNLHYHLSVLEREGFLRHERRGRKKTFFACVPPGYPLPRLLETL